METKDSTLKFFWNKLKKDIVLIVAFLAAVVSAFFVAPSRAYFGYIDFRVLSILLSLMLVVSGLKKAGIFSKIIGSILKITNNTRSLAILLTMVCFFSSMLITNDVALLTFVPLTIMILSSTDNSKMMIPVLVLETIAANLGSMLTPLGNPQNLYLYSLSGMTLSEFIGITGIPCAISLALIFICTLFIKINPINCGKAEKQKLEAKSVVPWLVLFALSILTVTYVVPYYVTLAVVIVWTLISDRKLFLYADYGLLLSFVFLFIFIGNMKNIPEISSMVSSLLSGHEITVSVLLSQVISNVPSAMLLSGFTDDFRSLILGTDVGGLGTIIASMASLITYKLYCVTQKAEKGKFMLHFTLLNLLFLGVLWFVAIMI